MNFKGKDLENRLIAELSRDGAVLREYIWLENESLALREYELRSGLYFYINDHLGAPRSGWWMLNSLLKNSSGKA